jgi:hypothetical protein
MAVNANIFIKNVHGGTFVFGHLFLQMLVSHIPIDESFFEYKLVREISFLLIIYVCQMAVS